MLRSPILFLAVALTLLGPSGMQAAENWNQRSWGPGNWGQGGRHWRGARGSGLATEGADVAPSFYEGLTARPRIVAPRAVSPTLPVATPPAWTASWYAYCAERYRSFDAETGTYLALSGRRRFCR